MPSATDGALTFYFITEGGIGVDTTTTPSIVITGVRFIPDLTASAGSVEKTDYFVNTFLLKETKEAVRQRLERALGRRDLSALGKDRATITVGTVFGKEEIATLLKDKMFNLTKFYME